MKSFNGKSLILNMIVKDESHIIQETLENVYQYIDYWVICDTGSTDGTQELIKAFFKRKGIPGELKEHQWKGFGYNRTLALQECKGKGDYIWVIDADDVIVGNLQFPKKMNADSYRLKYGEGFTYHRDQIFGNHLDWKYVGVLHEYIVCINKSNTNTPVIEGNYYIDSRRLGARSQDPDKYLKDAKTLVAGIEEELKRGDKNLAARYAFYAGQSYIDYGDNENAIKYYQMRIDMGGWFEETYYSYYKIAMAKKFLHKTEAEVEEAFLNAYNFLPSRAEPLYELALYFREKGNFKKGFRYSQKAIKIPYPKDQVLFIFKDVYDWKAKDEFAICAFYNENYQECYYVCVDLLNNKLLPEEHRNRIESNRDFCVPYLKDKLIKYNSALVKKITKNVKKTNRKLITYSVTTCKRFDLFEKTINSFLNCCIDVLQIDHWLCVDDNSSQEDRNKMKKLYPFFEFVWKKPEQKGHPESMNIIIERVSTPYLLHMEDDWQFFETKNYIKPALEILKEVPNLGQVCFNRNFAETLDDREIPGGILKFTFQNHHRYLIHEHYDPDSKEYADFNLRHHNRPSSCYWPHYSLRPSLLKTQIFKDVGKYNENTTHFEMEFSYRYFAKGYLTAFYDGICSLHIGRLTSERNDETKKNAYQLNDESQFGQRNKNDETKKETNSEKGNELKKNKSVSWEDTFQINLSDLMPDLENNDSSNNDSSNNDSNNYDDIIRSAQKAQNKNIPKGMEYITASPQVKNAIEEVISQTTSNRLVHKSSSQKNDSNDDKLKGKEFEGYLFFPNKDSMGHDIKHLSNKTVEELKEECDKDPNCLGFNTLGYLKHTISDEDDFITLPNYDGKLNGLYVNKKHWDNIIKSVIERLTGKKKAIAVVLKHIEDYDDFRVAMSRLLFHCRDIDSIKTWVCLNYDVDCDVQDKIKEDYPFIQHVIQKTEGESIKDVLQILDKDEIEYVFGTKNDICRQGFNLRDAFPHVEKEIYYYQKEDLGPFLVKLVEMDWS